MSKDIQRQQDTTFWLYCFFLSSFIQRRVRREVAVLSELGHPTKELRTVTGVSGLDRAEPPAPQPKLARLKAPLLAGAFSYGHSQREIRTL